MTSNNTQPSQQVPVAISNEAIKQLFYKVMGCEGGWALYEVTPGNVVQFARALLAQSPAASDAGLADDAKRYRFLRDKQAYVAVHPHYLDLPKEHRTGWTIRLMHGETLDAAIDTALASQEPQHG